MRKIVLPVVFCFVIVCCNNPNAQNKDSAGTESLSPNPYPIHADSVKITGEKIIRGESIWGNNEQYIFALMDSLSAVNEESRLFYFRVFARIVEQSDGYLAESVGLYILKYFENNPKEFIMHAKYISDSTFRFMGQHAGLELFLRSADDGKDAYNDLVKSVDQKLKELSKAENEKLNLFMKYIQESLNSQENVNTN